MDKRLRYICACLFANLIALGQPTEIVQDFNARFGQLSGAFVLLDVSGNRFIRHNPRQCSQRFSPASTFKIPNSLIGLETGVITDKNFVIPWDGVRRGNPEWNRDHTLESAVRFSVVPYFQELARRVGPERMKRWIDSLGYGNRDISGGIDRFWLGSTLAISANEQIDLLRRLQSGNLPFGQRNIDIVREILILARGSDYVLRGKTGFADSPGNKAVGWFVGYLEREGKVYLFATNITTDNAERDGAKIFELRKPVTRSILQDLGLLPADEVEKRE
jgi:beta-lactamase class D